MYWPACAGLGLKLRDGDESTLEVKVRSELSSAVGKLDIGGAGAHGAETLSYGPHKNRCLAGFLVRLNMSQTPGETAYAAHMPPSATAPRTLLPPFQ